MGRLFNVMKAMFSDRALRRIYESRRLREPTEANRNTLSIALCSLILLGLFAQLVSAAWVRQDATTWLKSRPAIVFPDADEVYWTITKFAPRNCGAARHCYRTVLGEERQFYPFRMRDPHVPYRDGIGTPDSTVGIVRLTLENSAFRSLAHLATLHLQLPRFSFRRADVFVDGEPVGVHYDTGNIVVPFDPRALYGPEVAIDLLLTVPWSMQGIVDADIYASGAGARLMIAPPEEMQEYQQVLFESASGRGEWPGLIARIVMGVFVVILFLFVNSAPETLALALFMGFEGLALALNQSWVRIPHHLFVEHFCFQMGDIMRLFFALQMARWIDKSPVPWLIVGALLSVPYGIMMENGIESSTHWVLFVRNYRDMVIGIIGVLVCGRTAWYLRGKGLPWRTSALVVAAVAFAEQVVYPLCATIPTLSMSSTIQSFVDIYHPSSAYLFALSAFVNIATLEQKVKHLSKAEAEVRRIKESHEARVGILQRFLTQKLAHRFSDDLTMEENLHRLLTPKRGFAGLVYADMRNSTDVARSIPAEELIDLLRSLYRRVVDHAQAIAQVKIVGDGVFFFVEDNQSTAERTATDLSLWLGCLLVRETAQVNQRRRKAGKEPVNFGVAVHFGEVIVGNLSSDNCVDYTAVGLHVNMAARYEALSKEAPVRDRVGDNGVIVSRRAYSTLNAYKSRIRKHLALGDVGVTVRNFPEVEEIYFLTEAEAVALAEDDRDLLRDHFAA